jgi:hypothetical protein
VGAAADLPSSRAKAAYDPPMQAARTRPQGVNALADITVLLAVVPTPIVFDVGANIG